MTADFSYAERSYIRRASSDHAPEVLAVKINMMREETWEQDVSVRDVREYLDQRAGKGRPSKKKRYIVASTVLSVTCGLAGLYTYSSGSSLFSKEMSKNMDALTEDGVGLEVLQLGRKYLEIMDDVEKSAEKILLKTELEKISENKGPDGRYAKSILEE